MASNLEYGILEATEDKKLIKALIRQRDIQFPKIVNNHNILAKYKTTGPPPTLEKVTTTKKHDEHHDGLDKTAVLQNIFLNAAATNKDFAKDMKKSLSDKSYQAYFNVTSPDPRGYFRALKKTFNELAPAHKLNKHKTKLNCDPDEATQKNASTAQPENDISTSGKLDLSQVPNNQLAIEVVNRMTSGTPTKLGNYMVALAANKGCFNFPKVLSQDGPSGSVEELAVGISWKNLGVKRKKKANKEELEDDKAERTKKKARTDDEQEERDPETGARRKPAKSQPYQSQIPDWVLPDEPNSSAGADENGNKSGTDQGSEENKSNMGEDGFGTLIKQEYDDTGTVLDNLH